MTFGKLERENEKREEEGRREEEEEGGERGDTCILNAINAGHPISMSTIVIIHNAVYNN